MSGQTGMQSQLCPCEMEAKTAEKANLIHNTSSVAVKYLTNAGTNWSESNPVHEAINLITNHIYLPGNQVELEKF